MFLIIADFISYQFDILQNIYILFFLSCFITAGNCNSCTRELCENCNWSTSTTYPTPVPSTSVVSSPDTEEVGKQSTKIYYYITCPCVQPNKDERLDKHCISNEKS